MATVKNCSSLWSDIKFKNKNNMKPVHLTLISRLCMAVLAMLGFGSCENLLRCEYGTPNSDYKIIGTVTDTEGTPIEGIRVVVPYTGYDYEHGYPTSDTLYTDVKGTYATPEHNDMTVAENGMIFEDVDGEKNGSFLSRTLTHEEVRNATHQQYKKGDGHWYSGGYEYTVDVTLDKQPQ